ncbi:MAG: NAD(P)-binding protein, partial [Actinomycetota bacterium]
MTRRGANRVVVVGAGITGLAAAHRLLASATVPLEVTVLDAADRAGGLIRATRNAGRAGGGVGADALRAGVRHARELAAAVGM